LVKSGQKVKDGQRRGVYLQILIFLGYRIENGLL